MLGFLPLKSPDAYGWLVIAGILLSLGLWSRLARKDERLIMLYIAALAGAFLGAKLVYLGAEGWLHWNDPDRWLKWATGKSILGGLLGGYLSVELAKAVLGYYNPTGDWFAVVTPLSIMLGRIGCATHGCCLGVIWPAAWYTVTDVHGLSRWPAPQMELLFNTVALGLIVLCRRRSLLPGQHFHLYLMAYGFFRFWHESLRATPRILGPVTGYQIAALAVFCLGAFRFIQRQAAVLVIAPRLSRIVPKILYPTRLNGGRSLDKASDSAPHWEHHGSMNQRHDYPGFWQAVLLCVTFVGLQIVLTMPFGILDAVVHVQLASHPAVVGVVNLMACTLVLGMGWLIGRPPMSEVWALRQVAPLAVAGVIVSSGGAMILLSEADNLLRTVLPPPDWIVHILGNLSLSSDHLWASMFLLMIVAPVTEELMFRGLILRGLLRRFSLPRAFLLSSMLFGAVHLNPWQFVSALGLGLMFAWWYARTQSLIPSLIGHALANSIVFWNQFIPFRVPGFNVVNQFDTTALQPLWFDLFGAFLVAAGFWLFHRATPPIRRLVAPVSEPVSQIPVETDWGAPPIIQPGTAELDGQPLQGRSSQGTQA
jgi:phosphatidylglycerol---prolipoprotein diacylglyceryl transferase